MRRKVKEAYITDKEALLEVKNRTGYSMRAVLGIIHTYYQVIEEAIESRVQVKSKLGTYSWKVRGPAGSRRFFNVYTNQWDVSKNRGAYRYPMFFPSQTWKKRLRQATEGIETDLVEVVKYNASNICRYEEVDEEGEESK